MKLIKQSSSETQLEIAYEPWKSVSSQVPLLNDSNSIFQRFVIKLGGNNSAKPEIMIKMLQNIIYLPKLLSFDFILGYCNNINGDVLKCLVNSIQQSKNLKFLTLTFDVETLNTVKMTVLDLQEITVAFSQLPTLQQLHLSVNRNQVESLGFISTLLTYQTKMKSLKLDLESHDIQPNEINTIFDSFQKLQNLVELNVTIKKNQKPVSYVDKLFNVIQNLKNLSSLNFVLDFCNLAVPKFNANQQIDLKILNMSFTNTRCFTTGFYEQFRYLNCLPNLEQLNITFGQNNKIGMCGLQALKETFLQLKNLKNFSLKIDQNNGIESTMLFEMITSLDVFLNMTDLNVIWKTDCNWIKSNSNNGSTFSLEVVKDTYNDSEVNKGFQQAIQCLKYLKKIRTESKQYIRSMPEFLENTSNIEEIEIIVIHSEDNLKCILSLLKNTAYFNAKSLSIDILNCQETPSKELVYEFANSLQQFNSLKKLRYNFCKYLTVDISLIIQSISQNMHNNENFVADILFTPINFISQNDNLDQFINTLIESSNNSKHLNLVIDDYSEYIRLTLENIDIQINYSQINPLLLIEPICYALISLDDSSISFKFEFQSSSIKLKAKNSVNFEKPCEMFDIEKSLEGMFGTQNEQYLKQNLLQRRVDFLLLFDIPFDSELKYQNRYLNLQCKSFKLLLNSNAIEELDLTCNIAASKRQCYNSLFSLRQLKSLTLDISSIGYNLQDQNEERLISQQESKLYVLQLFTFISQSEKQRIKKILTRLCKSYFKFTK